MRGTGLVGGAIGRALEEGYQVVVTAGHQDVAGGWRLTAEEPERLLEILNREEPDIVISSIRGEFPAQLRFHHALADWMAGKEKRLLYISTANVFDGDLSRPWTEADPPAPESDYGRFKRDCENLLREKLPGQWIIFRLSAVWAPECPRLRRLEACSRRGEPVHTCRGIWVNLSPANQIGMYAKYVLDNDLTGIFHVGTRDTVDYFDFEKMVCNTLGIPLPRFEVETVEGPVYQAVLPARAGIPEALQQTVAQTLRALKENRGS